MVERFTVIKNFIEETRDKIVDVVPEYDPQIRFSPRSNISKASSKFKDSLKQVRKFEIGLPITQEYPMMGNNYNHEKKTYDIRIWYPTTSGDIWRMAAESDSSKIYTAIMTSSTSVSGVQTRFIERDRFPVIEFNENDPWFIMVIPITVYYEFTG
jgi:hypothetical protein